MTAGRIPVAALAAAVTLGATTLYRDGPPPGHTGAFGEPDCGACHFDAPRNGSGTVGLAVPGEYRPGETYEIGVAVRHDQLEAGGFQLTARFADGERAGAQAGELAPCSDRTRVQSGTTGVQYASHTIEGVAPEEAGSIQWKVLWTAPEEPGTVAFDVAANAANDDSSEFGDRLLFTRALAQPSGARGVSQTGAAARSSIAPPPRGASFGTIIRSHDQESP